ncbi:MAG: ketopantoate reductase family protein [Eggerthellaceae bacterium]
MLCKSFDTEKTVRDNLELVGDGTVVMSLQNGLGAEDTLCDIVGAHRVIGGKTYIGGIFGAGPRQAQSQDTFIGELDGSVTEARGQTGAAFEDAGMRCIVSDNILGVIWDKLRERGDGAVLLTGLPYGDMYQEEAGGDRGRRGGHGRGAPPGSPSAARTDGHPRAGAPCRTTSSPRSSRAWKRRPPDRRDQRSRGRPGQAGFHARLETLVACVVGIERYIQVPARSAREVVADVRRRIGVLKLANTGPPDRGTSSPDR